jgi:hypothetical protein
MLKTWVPAVNLTSTNSIGKLLLQSAQTDSIKESRAVFIIYLIILTSYVLLDIGKQSVSANPVVETIIAKQIEQPEQNFSQDKSIATNPSCLLEAPNTDLLGSKSSNIARRSASLQDPDNPDLQNGSNSGKIALTESIDWVKYLQILDLDLSAIPATAIDALAQTPPDRQNSGSANNIAFSDSIFVPKGSANDLLKLIEITDPRQLQMLKPGDLFTLPTLLPRMVPSVPTDRPFIAPATPTVSPVAPPETRTPIQLPKGKPAIAPKPDPRFLIAPRQLDLNQLNPAFTQVVVNDVVVNHRTQAEVTGGIETGDRRTTDVGLNATGLYSPKVEESVSDKRVYRIDYRSTYAQVRTLRQQREIKTTTITPETLFGMRQQISFTGDCLPGSGNNTVSATGDKLICSYLPGLKTDEASIDTQRLIPTRIPTTGAFGEVVTPESLAAMREPGFQSGANGQQVGLDLYFPRIGAQPGNSFATDSKFDRFESNNTVPMASIGRIHQVIVANGKNTAIARTVRGFNYIYGDLNTGWMAGIQAATELIPDFEPVIPNGKKGGSTAVDRNLLLAANNNRTPDNSFTAYYSGVGRGITPTGNQNNTANYHGLWVGFSPVVDRQVVSVGPVFKVLGPEKIVLFAGGEGGVKSSSTVTALVNQNSFDSSAITNGYVQTYLTRYEREVDTISSTTIRERTNYYPHLSATGNITTQDSVLRYYAGFIFNPNSNSANIASKTYLGVDYTKVEGSGLTYNLGAIGYLNPDSEYYSKLTGTISKQIGLGKNPAYNLNLSAGVNYAIDGTKIFDAVSFKSANSYVNVGARLGLGDVSLGTTYYQATSMPNSIGNLLSTNASWKISDGLILSGYYTPVNDNIARSPFGASASIRLGGNIYSPTLSLGWNRNEVDLGVNSSNARSGVSDNVFSVFLRFDAPPNIFK